MPFDPDKYREMASETRHGGCNSFECVECGGKLLHECSCQVCFEECDYDEVVKSEPEDGLCTACRKCLATKNKPAPMTEHLGDITLLLLLLPIWWM